jgi:hypothetical protein
MTRDYKGDSVEDAYSKIADMTDDELKDAIAEGEALIASVPMVRSKVDMLRGFLVGRTVGRQETASDPGVVVPLRAVDEAPVGDDSEG